MKTSQQWWDEVKADSEKTLTWLKKQYVGEMQASLRILDLITLHGSKSSSAEIKTLNMIAAQEALHGSWIANLLEARGVDVLEIQHENKRYWDETLKGIEDMDTGCAVATHAEAMRLERIRVICNDESAPADIRAVFQKILPQEEWHEEAFRKMSTPATIERMRSNHEAGCNALGLVL